MSTNVQVDYVKAFDNSSSPEYVELARQYTTAIDELYSRIPGDHLTRITNITWVHAQENHVWLNVIKNRLVLFRKRQYEYRFSHNDAMF